MDADMYHLGNAHDPEVVSKEVSVPDYYPLRRDEIEELLRVAQSTTDRLVLSSVELRLYQGIWGYTSFVELHGSVETAQRRIGQLFRNNYQAGPSEAFVSELWECMRAPFRDRL